MRIRAKHPAAIIAIALVLIGHAAAPAGAAPAIRTPILLPPLVAGGSASASAINQAGTVVGSASLDDGYWHATAWTKGKIKDLGTLGGPNSQAQDIDDNGQIVGFAQTPDGTAHAVVWVGGRIHDLGAFTDGGYAEASSNGNVALTWSVDGSSPWSGSRAAVMTGTPSTGFTITDIDVAPGASAVAVNASGTIAGSNHQIDYGLPGWNSAQAYIWHNGVSRNLGTLGGPSSFAYDINDAGHVIGRSDVDGDGSGAFFWNGATMRALAAPAGASPTADAINNSDVITGTYGSGNHAVVWESPAASPQRLQEPEGSAGSIAVDINQRGAIAGQIEYTQPEYHTVAVVWR